MRRVLVGSALAASLTVVLAGAGAAPALAAPPGPKIPDLTDCHEVNDLLGIDNVRDCDNSS